MSSWGTSRCNWRVPPSHSTAVSSWSLLASVSSDRAPPDHLSLRSPHLWCNLSCAGRGWGIIGSSRRVRRTCSSIAPRGKTCLTPLVWVCSAGGSGPCRVGVPIPCLAPLASLLDALPGVSCGGAAGSSENLACNCGPSSSVNFRAPSSACRLKSCSRCSWGSRFGTQRLCVASVGGKSSQFRCCRGMDTRLSCNFRTISRGWIGPITRKFARNGGILCESSQWYYWGFCFTLPGGTCFGTGCIWSHPSPTTAWCNFDGRSACNCCTGLIWKRYLGR